MNLEPIHKLIAGEVEYTIWFQLKEKFKESTIVEEVLHHTELKVHQIDDLADSLFNDEP